VYFGPQDAAIGALAFLNGRAASNSFNRPVDVKDPQAALEKFYAKKGLSQETFNVTGGGKHMEVRFANVYN
jgi:hypothetical protein